MKMVQISWQSHALSEHELTLQARNWNKSRHRFLFHGQCFFSHDDQNTHKYILPIEQIQESSQWQEFKYTIGKRLWDVTHDAKNVTLLFARKKTLVASDFLSIWAYCTDISWWTLTNAESFSTSKNLRIWNWTW